MVKVKIEAFSLQQTADVLHVDVMTVRRWIKKGNIQAFRVGKKLWRVSLAELNRMRKVREQ